MAPPPITSEPVASRVLLVGQAPGAREPKLGKPFAWTAGKTLFRWLEQATGMNEESLRQRLYIAAVCRCFPGRTASGGDRVPNQKEINACQPWLEAEMRLLRPHLVLPVGKLAICQFMPVSTLSEAVGRCLPQFRWRDHPPFDLLPLPHPSGASTWVHQNPGKALTATALDLLASHPAMRALREDP